MITLVNKTIYQNPGGITSGTLSLSSPASVGNALLVVATASGVLGGITMQTDAGDSLFIASGLVASNGVEAIILNRRPLPHTANSLIWSSGAGTQWSFVVYEVSGTQPYTLNAFTENHTGSNVSSWVSASQAASAHSTFYIFAGVSGAGSGGVITGASPGTMDSLELAGGVINQAGSVYLVSSGTNSTTFSISPAAPMLSVAVSLEESNPNPTVLSVDPDHGPTAGGTAVTITGTGFQTGAVPTFGVPQATNIVVVNSTTITCLTPPHAAGSVTVTVTNPDTTSGSLPNGYDYIQVYDFHYVKSFPLDGGDLYTVALDAGGQIWSEKVVSANHVLEPLVPTVAIDSYMLSTTLDDVEYMCFSDLEQGVDIPRQYNPQPATGGYTLDRVSQVGPGAPPTFQVSGSAGSQVTISSWSGSGGVVTFQAVNSFTAGEVVKLSGFSVSTFFNGKAFSVLGTGLSGTQFQIAFSGYSGGTDSGVATPQYSYDIQSIQQIAQKSDPEDPGHFQALLWSSGPGSTQTGNVITVYYANAFSQGQDNDLVNTFNSGIPTYVYISNAPFGNGTWLVTSVGIGIPPGGEYSRWFFTIQALSSNYQFFGGPDDASGYYQQTIATLVVKTPIPGLSDGDQITITTASPSGWNDTWTIVNTLLSGVYSITQTEMTNGTATYSWTWSGSGTAVAPQKGQLVTVIQTLNGNGVFNVVDAVIASVTGGPNSGTFTIANFSPPQTIPAEAEDGQAQTAGTQFQFDPGSQTVGTNTSPIYGNDSNTGVVAIVGSNTSIGAGTRQAVVFFETRNGFKTPCSAPVTFTTNSNANYILASNIPIGPPNVIRRWIAFTGAGPNGIPGPNFYTIDTPVSYSINNQKYLYSATYIDDNITTQFKFTFTDAVLLSGEEIDVQGNDLFNQIELGESAWNIAYAERMFYGLELNKVNNFTNLTFDGGYLPNAGGNLSPLGWGIDAASNINSGNPATITAFSITSNVVTFTAVNAFFVGQQVFISGLAVGTYLNNVTFNVLSSNGASFTCSASGFSHGNVGNTADSGLATPLAVGATLVVSPVFGNAYYIKNSIGGTQATLGMIVQNAYQDAYNVPIILPNTLYSVRVTASIPSAQTTGNLIIDLTEFNTGLISGTGIITGYGATYGTFTLPFASMSETPTTFTGTLLTSPFTQGVPIGLLLRVWAKNIGYGCDVQIDRIEIFPTANPVLTTNIRVSYADNFEAFDGVTGNLGLASHNTQAAFGAFVLHDQLYFLQSASMQVTQDIPGVEPSGPGGGWALHEVSNRVGAIGIHAYDYGEEWVLTACRNGVFGFNGGQPMRIDFQQKEIWEAINWDAGHTIVLRNDLANRRIMCAIPLPTPNRWLPNAPVNATPTSPNVVIMWNYQGLDDFQELVSGRALHTTMFGTLMCTDMRLKCSLWQITTPYIGLITQPDKISQIVTICNGAGNGKIYQLTPGALSDDGAAINSTYSTFGFVNSAKASQNPLLGFHRKRFSVLQTLISGTGTAALNLYPNYILNPNSLVFNPNAWTVPGGIALQEQPIDDLIRPLNIAGNRVYVVYSTNAPGAAFNLSKLIMVGIIDQLTTLNPSAG